MRKVISSIVLLLLFGAGLWYAVGTRFLAKDKAELTNNESAPLPPPLSYETKPAIGFLAPDFLLKTLDGREVRLSDHLGQVVVLNFWTSQCPFCLMELKNFSRLAAEYQKKLVVIAINRGEAPVTVGNYLSRYIQPADIVFLLDPDNITYRRYGVEALPETFIVDSSGVMRDHKLGELTFEEMSRRAKAVLEAASSPTGR
jgi:peroxiredoxin